MRPDLKDRNFRLISRQLEALTSYDSIDTIERIYDRTESGNIMCCYSTKRAGLCQFRSRDPQQVWIHVHFTTHGAHGLAWGFDRQTFVEATDYRELIEQAIEHCRPPDGRNPW